MHPVFALYLEEYHNPGTFDRYELANNDYYARVLDEERAMKYEVVRQLEAWATGRAKGEFLKALRGLLKNEPDLSALTLHQQEVVCAFYKLLHYGRALDPNTNVESIYRETLMILSVV